MFFTAYHDNLRTETQLLSCTEMGLLLDTTKFIEATLFQVAVCYMNSFVAQFVIMYITIKVHEGPPTASPLAPSTLLAQGIH